jgi:hypothetical protein
LIKLKKKIKKIKVKKRLKKKEKINKKALSKKKLIKKMKTKIITNKNFFGYGLALLLYINTIFELELFTLGLRVSELCIIGILLFVIILIFNEINNLLRETFTAKNIKYYKNTNFYSSRTLIDNNIDIQKPIINSEVLPIKSTNIYTLLISLL